MESLNHIQMIEEDAYAIVSEKVKNAIVKVHIESERVKFIVGGPNGTYDLIDQFGEHFEPGTSLWYGQHNAEYFGSKEYLLFDDQTSWVQTSTTDYETKTSNTSRLLVVEIDEDTKTATITWAYPLDYHTNHFGDCDMLPTGNILGAGWLTQKLPDGSHPPMEAQIIEVTRDTKEVAWELMVVGNTTEDYKESDELVLFRSWAIYSAERMYSKPLVYGISCTETAGSHAKINFTTNNRFKEANSYPGSYEIKIADGTIITRGKFDYEPYFRATTVSLRVGVSSDGICEKGTITVMNMWSDSSTKRLKNL